MHAEEPEDSGPSLDDVVDILVGRMESHPEEFEKYGVFDAFVDDLKRWVRWRDNADEYTRPLDLDFFSEEQKLRLWEGLKGARCKAFTAKVLEQVFKPKTELKSYTTPTPQVVYRPSYYEHMSDMIAAQSAANERLNNRSMLGVLGDQLTNINLLGKNK